MEIWSTVDIEKSFFKVNNGVACSALYILCHPATIDRLSHANHQTLLDLLYKTFKQSCKDVDNSFETHSSKANIISTVRKFHDGISDYIQDFLYQISIIKYEHEIIFCKCIIIPYTLSREVCSEDPALLVAVQT